MMEKFKTTTSTDIKLLKEAESQTALFGDFELVYDEDKKQTTIYSYNISDFYAFGVAVGVLLLHSKIKDEH
jgi:hypothetical protein